jgi:glutamate-1-semialdehyde aminotransferase
VYEDRERLAGLWQSELEVFRAARPASRDEFDRAVEHMPDGVPMLWMAKWPGPWPVYVSRASGAHFECVDGIDHVDLCLGDTGAMCGHAPEASVRAISEQLAKGSTFMLPTEDAAAAAELLAERFRVPVWQFALSATDANRSLIRYARQVTGRPRILVHDHCYHGTVDEAYATLDESGAVVSRRGNIGAPVELNETTAVVQFNDIPALEAALAKGDIAAVLIEPALTNIGVVLPDDGYHEAVRELCTRYGTLLIIDETHTISAGPGGMITTHDLHPDAVVLGKSIGGGIPAGAYGMTRAFAAAVRESLDLEDIDVGGVGGTLAGNAVSLAGIRATLSQVLTAEAFVGMIDRATEWTAGVQAALDEFEVPWQVTQLGARAEYSFRPTAPHDGAEAADADDFELQQYLHLHALNRGILMTPFHNMALMCPATTAADVERHTVAFREAVASLYASPQSSTRSDG